MVVMRGLPFNVSLQDILNFYQGFPEVCPSTATYLLYFQIIHTTGLTLATLHWAVLENTADNKHKS